ncbi:MAG: ribosomal L7Ae/L30e/S12e/Gadd45 family protein [Clostridiales bacterium]|nr:ribosomal L7Ae/L30e/S12e/Gadd45 family protein [Clostridiales bacterium]
MATVAGGDKPPRLKEYSPGAETLRIGNYFGLAMKAGRVAAGDAAAEKALKAGFGCLLVLAGDVSPAVAKELIFLAKKYSLPLLWWQDKASLGLTVGKSRRGALVLTDKGFSNAILKLCEEYTLKNFPNEGEEC